MTATCTQPGCTGQIEDGYCNVCGVKPTGAGSSLPVPPSATALSPARADGSGCQQPGCTGTILDGYCDVCGIKAGPASAVSTAANNTGGGAGDGGSSDSAPLTTGQYSARSARTAHLAHGTVSSARSTRTTASARTTSRLGHGLVVVPPVPVADPSLVIMANAIVTEDKRFCGDCNTPVGRSRDGRPGRDSGFCGKCGKPFDFAPKLKSGDVIGGQYEVVGCLAHGGLGWIYLGRDRNVDNRWVVLKGVLDSGDPAAQAVAVAERRFLSSVEHPSIVKIYNFVQHEGAGYTVMEYVGGKSLKQLLKDRREANGGTPDPLDVEHAIAYMLELLPAFNYLHSLGLIYCDLKPDNLIQQGDNLKLIDLGGLHRLGDTQSAIYGTVGFQAPEIADHGPSVASDLYTVARTLAVLATDFRGYQGEFRYTLQTPGDEQLYRTHDSLYRLLLKATAPLRDDRYQTAEEMTEQLLGVLREIVSQKRGTPAAAASTVFGGDRLAHTNRGALDVRRPLEWGQLPRLRIDASDPAAAETATRAADPSATKESVLEAATTPVAMLVASDYLVEGQHAQDASTLLDMLASVDPWEWRVDWFRGVLSMAADDHDASLGAFDRVYSDVPGELAPKLALGVAFEKAGKLASAAAMYDTVATTDAGYVSALFGLSRCLAQSGDRARSLAALERVPESSSLYVDARMQMVRTLMIGPDAKAAPVEADLARASAIAERLPLDSVRRADLERELFEQLLPAVESTPDLAWVRFLGHQLSPASVRKALERSYRFMARQAPTKAERYALVDKANAIRPRTLW